MHRAQVTEKHLRVQLPNLNNSWPLQENVKDQFDLFSCFSPDAEGTRAGTSSAFSGCRAYLNREKQAWALPRYLQKAQSKRL